MDTNKGGYGCIINDVLNEHFNLSKYLCFKQRISAAMFSSNKDAAITTLLSERITEYQHVISQHHSLFHCVGATMDGL